MIPVLYLAYHFSERALRSRALTPLLPAHGIRPLVVCAEADGAPFAGCDADGATGGTADEADGSGRDVGPGRGDGGSSGCRIACVPDPFPAFARRLTRGGRRSDAGEPGPSALAPGPNRPPHPTPSSSRSADPWWHGLEERIALPDRHAFWIAPAVRAGMRLAARHGCQAVFASCGPPSSLVAGARLAARLRVPLVCEFRDLWVDNHFRAYHSRLRRRLDRAWERSLLRRAAAVVVVTPPMAEILRAAHPWLPEPRLHWIPNGFDPALLDEAEIAPASARALAATPATVPSRPGGPRPPDGRPRLLFAGRLYANMPSAALAAALRRLAATGPPEAVPVARFVGWIDGPHRAVVAGLCAEGLAEVRPPCSYAESVEEMRRADALLVLLGSGPGMEMVMTSKIFPYLATGRPVVAAVPPDGVAAGLVREAGAGAVVPPDEPDALAAAIRRALGGSPEHAPDALARRREALRPYAWPVLAERLADLLRSVSAERAGQA